MNLFYPNIRSSDNLISVSSPFWIQYLNIEYGDVNKNVQV